MSSIAETLLEFLKEEKKVARLTYDKLGQRHNVTGSYLQRIFTDRDAGGVSLRVAQTMFPRATVSLNGDTVPSTTVNQVNSPAAIIGSGNITFPCAAAVEDFRRRAMAAVVGMDLPPEKALERIGKAILETQGEAARHLGQARAIIEARQGMMLSEGIERYRAWMEGPAKLRPGTVKKYLGCLAQMAQALGRDRAVEALTRADAAQARDALAAQGLSPTTLSCIFSAFRCAIRWMVKDGLVFSPGLADAFLVDLPAVRKVNTPIIPPSAADAAMLAVPSWTLVPRIQRYTGMRIAEVEACLAGYDGCGIVVSEGYRCFHISRDFSKTHDERYVPIADRLAPHLTEAAIQAARSQCRDFSAPGHAAESPWQKRYNRAVKRVEGCAGCKDHSWRVYAQTMMIEAGVDDLIVRRIIGHRASSDVHYGYTAGRLEAMKHALDRIP